MDLVLDCIMFLIYNLYYCILPKLFTSILDGGSNMGNLSRYTLSWSVFLFTIILLSSPLCEELINVAKVKHGKIVLSAIFVGGVLPYGYMINLFPLLFFRYINSLGVFKKAKEKNKIKLPSWIITSEMKAQCFLFEKRIKSLNEGEKIIHEARLSRNNNWTHLVIHYNLITTLIMAVFFWLLIAYITNKWKTGISIMINREIPFILNCFIFGSLTFIFIILFLTACQSRWELIEMYRLELERLSNLNNSNGHQNDHLQS